MSSSIQNPWPDSRIATGTSGVPRPVPSSLASKPSAFNVWLMSPVTLTACTSARASSV